MTTTERRTGGPAHPNGWTTTGMPTVRPPRTTPSTTSALSSSSGYSVAHPPDRPSWTSAAVGASSPSAATHLPRPVRLGASSTAPSACGAASDCSTSRAERRSSVW